MFFKNALMTHCQEIMCWRNFTLLQMIWSYRLIVVSFMYPGLYCKKITGCKILILFQMAKSIREKIHILCMTQLTWKIIWNHRGWSKRARKRIWSVLGVKYDLAGVLFMAIANVIFYPQPPIALWHTINGQLKHWNIIRVQRMKITMQIKVNSMGLILYFQERQKESWVLVKLCGWKLVPSKMVPKTW